MGGIVSRKKKPHPPSTAHEPSCTLNVKKKIEILKSASDVFKSECFASKIENDTSKIKTSVSEVPVEDKQVARDDHMSSTKSHVVSESTLPISCGHSSSTQLQESALTESSTGFEHAIDWSGSKPSVQCSSSVCVELQCDLKVDEECQDDATRNRSEISEVLADPHEPCHPAPVLGQIKNPGDLIEDLSKPAALSRDEHNEMSRKDSTSQSDGARIITHATAVVNRSSPLPASQYDKETFSNKFQNRYQPETLQATKVGGDYDVGGVRDLKTGNRRVMVITLPLPLVQQPESCLLDYDAAAVALDSDWWHKAVRRTAAQDVRFSRLELTAASHASEAADDESTHDSCHSGASWRPGPYSIAVPVHFGDSAAPVTLGVDAGAGVGGFRAVVVATATPAEARWVPSSSLKASVRQGLWLRLLLFRCSARTTVVLLPSGLALRLLGLFPEYCGAQQTCLAGMR
jgi:hypothetical protein